MTGSEGSQGCADEETLLRFVKGQAAPGEAQLVEEHLDTCAVCRHVVAEAAKAIFQQAVEPPSDAILPAHTPRSGMRAVSPPAPALTAGTRISSRYEILGRIDSGGAGVVYRAHDAQLQRQVAIKLIPLSSRHVAARQDEEPDVLREARAMAQLSHPNVVNVHDAGIFEEQIFIVMEMVQGTTLEEWARRGKRGWRDVVPVFIDTGQGLAAAHAARIVHGDFKPANVLVSGDGRARVTDFGLSRSMRGVAVLAGSAIPGSPTTTVSGTPAYMAPEQFLGAPTNEQTDQFSFCVALYLALYGEHPFAPRESEGDPLLNLARQVIAGQVRPGPSGHDVPAWLREILVRGMAANPGDRFPSMPALLDQINRGMARDREGTLIRRVRRVTSVRALAVVGGVALAGLAGWRALVAGSCGNGAVEAGEQCDDGNKSDADGCLSTCRFATCGDGKARMGVEECDDGNARDGDGCSHACQTCRAGDLAFVWAQNGHCYTRHDVPAAWRAGREVCAGAGSDLVTYTSSYETAAVNLGLRLAELGATWTGLALAGAPGARSFAWVTGEPVMSSRTWWAPGDGSAPGRECVQAVVPDPPVAIADRPLLWRPAVCESAAAIVCEKPNWLVRQKNNHAYLVISHPATWSAAREACARLGSGIHLATITDAEEEAYVAAGGLLDMWIGGTDAAKEGTFTWITNESFVYQAFAPNEPDNEGPSDCLLLALDKGWHDRRCGDQHAYVCEHD